MGRKRERACRSQAEADKTTRAVRGELERERRDRAEERGRLEGNVLALRGTLEETLRSVALCEAREKRKELAAHTFELGRAVYVGASAFGTGGRDAWEEGEAELSLRRRQAALLSRREQLEKAGRERCNRKRRDATQRKKKGQLLAAEDDQKVSSSSSSSSSSSETAITASCGASSNKEETTASSSQHWTSEDVEMLADEETAKSHLTALKRDEQELCAERCAVERRKLKHVREWSRVRAEDSSRFRHRPKLNADRYLLLSLLGKGGFSEVWLAFDFLESRRVAVKFHQLDHAWSEDRKRAYVRHAAREYAIQRDLDHPRVVRLWDCFEVDDDTFATVLELCTGEDLDARLRARKTLPEREARAVVLQVLAGLRHLHTPQRCAAAAAKSSQHLQQSASCAAMICVDIHGEQLTAGVSQSSSSVASQPQTSQCAAMPPPPPARARGAIIHYDLKPGNILFDEHGDAKITDFGLSKIVPTEDALAEDLGSSRSCFPGGAGGLDMELTSQGAGTYWYLPPECFATATLENPVRISGKVDVWSVGVIFFQMLYGERPFGEGQSQQRLLQERTMLRATTVRFPAKPNVSDDAKDFLRACLCPTQQDRPDVRDLCNHTYARKQL